MNQFYRNYIGDAKAIAQKYKIDWNPPYEPNGKIQLSSRWNLTQLAGLAPPPTMWMGSFSIFDKAIEPLNKILLRKGLPCPDAIIMSNSWIEYYKASIITELLIKRNKPGHTYNNIGKIIRLLATCLPHSEPWNISADNVTLAYNVALLIGESGKIAANLEMIIRTIIDSGHLADRGPLAIFCREYADPDAVIAAARVSAMRKSVNSQKRTEDQLRSLSQRKRDDRLPDERSLWELIRIVLTENPKTYADAIRFAFIKIGIVTGFRAVENTMIPCDWQRWREYRDTSGRSADQSKGIARSLMIRCFAEKQDQQLGADGFIAYETSQHIPPMFENLVIDTLYNVARLTKPLRNRIRRQVETSRLIPEYEPSALIHCTEAFTRISGNIQISCESIPNNLIIKYRNSYNLSDLNVIRNHQQEAFIYHGASNALRNFMARIYSFIPIRNKSGLITSGNNTRYADAWFQVSDLESYIRDHLPTKVSDTIPFNLVNSQKLYPHESMFLMPIRALSEARNEGITDIDRYCAVGRLSYNDIFIHLGGNNENNLFVRYMGEEGIGLSLNNHSLRHLQNSELLRLGVADTIVTKRFRKSQIQTGDYDHRSLAESLEAINIPDEDYDRLGSQAADTYKLIKSDRVSGPIVDEFRHLQVTHGDDVAFEFLSAETDGLHVTPYGLCLNSFSIDPCPKNLECFTGCCHLGRTERTDEQANLEQLHQRLSAVAQKLTETPPDQRKWGWNNQMTHVTERLAGIDAALKTRPGTKVFPDGNDKFVSIETKVGTTVMDTTRRLRRAED
jgi:hypothetical protein